MSKVCLIVDLDVAPDKVEAFAKMFRTEFITRSKTEAGCEVYELTQDPETPTKMTIVEIWSDAEALKTHANLPWFAEWAPKMRDMQNTPLVVRRMTVL